MLFLQNLPEVDDYIDKMNSELKKINPKRTGLSLIQKKWFSFCLTAILVTGKISWEAYQRASAGSWKAKALSWMMHHSPIPWNYLLIASTLTLCIYYNIREGVLVLDDVDRDRSKKTKNIFGTHKTRLKNGGGFGQVQNLVVLMLISKKISIPVGFHFYRPDPVRKEWAENDKKLREQGIPKGRRPEDPGYQKDYPPKKKIAMTLLRRFKRYFHWVNITAIAADSAYCSKETRADCARIYPKSTLVSQLRRNQLVMTRKGKYVPLERYFTRQHKKIKKVSIRGKEKIIHYASARLFVKSLGRKVHIVSMIYDGGRKVKYTCCTNLTWRAEDIIQKYAYRWLIEVFFEDWKAYDSWGESACQYYYDGACSGVILSLLLDHFLLQHPMQLHLGRTGRPLYTAGSMKRKLQFESLLQSIEVILGDPDPRQRFELLKQSMDGYLTMNSSDKHMSGRDFYEVQYSPHLYRHYKNSA